MLTASFRHIRGIGANFSNVGVENPIGVFVDGAYIDP